jgi:hypothetical protein
MDMWFCGKISFSRTRQTDTGLTHQGYHRLRERFPGILSCTEERFIQAVTEMKVPFL